MQVPLKSYMELTADKPNVAVATSMAVSGAVAAGNVDLTLRVEAILLKDGYATLPLLGDTTLTVKSSSVTRSDAGTKSSSRSDANPTVACVGLVGDMHTLMLDGQRGAYVVELAVQAPHCPRPVAPACAVWG